MGGLPVTDNELAHSDSTGVVGYVFRKIGVRCLLWSVVISGPLPDQRYMLSVPRGPGLPPVIRGGQCTDTSRLFPSDAYGSHGHLPVFSRVPAQQPRLEEL